MPIRPTYPGVYVEEMPSAVRTITGVATSTAAFVDRFARGPIDEAVRITSFSDFERDFGGLHTLSEASYGIQQFFLNGGTEAWVVRVGVDGAPADPLAAATAVLAGAGANLINVRAARRMRGASVDNPGTWGNNLRVEVDHDVVRPTEQVDPFQVQALEELFNLTISEIELRNGRTFVARTETFRNLTLREGARNNALAVVNEGSKLVQLDRNGLAALPVPPAPQPRPDASGTLGFTLPGVPVIPNDGDQLEVVIDPAGPAAPAAEPAVTITIAYGATPPPTTYVGFRPFLEAAIRAAAPNDPHLAGAVVELVGNRFRVRLGRSGAGFHPATTATFQNHLADTTADDLRLSGLLGQEAVVRAQQFALTGGGDGIALTAPAIRGTRLAKTGLYALEDADLFNILCLPAAAELGGVDMRATYAEATAYCEERRAFLIIDLPPATDDLDAMDTWLNDNNGLRHRNAAVYFPRVRIADALAQGRLRAVGASGTMAGLYAQTDAARGVWKAPAGTEVRLRGVQDFDYLLTDRENGIINPLGVNGLRNFPVYGNIAWGARTLDGADQLASEWKYVPIRRLALYLEESLFRGTKWVVFEPNDEPLWSQIRLNLGTFMHNLFRQGAFQGSTPKDAYFVKCDGETTTQADRDLGIVNIVVGFAPLKPAEFVILRFQQIAGQLPA